MKTAQRPIKQQRAWFQRTSLSGATPANRRPPPEASRPRTFWLLIMSIGTFALGVDGFVLSGLLPQVSRDLRVSVGTAGQLTTIFALVYAVGSPIIGAVTSSWERRTVLRSGMAIFVLGAGLQAVGQSFAVVAVGRVFAALGAAAYLANAYSTVALISEDRVRARSLALVAGGGSLALVAGLPFGVFVGQALGWRAAMWMIVGLAVVSGLAVGLLPAVYAPRTRLRERLRVLRDRNVGGLLLATLAVLTPSFLTIAYIPAVLGASGSVVVLGMIALGSGQVLGTALVAQIINRWGAWTALVAGACLITVAAGGLGLLHATPTAALICLAVLGLGTGSVTVPQQSRLFDLAPTQAPVVLGLNGSAIYLASALGGAIGGVDLAVAHAVAIPLTACAIGIAGICIANLVRPEHR